MGSLVFDRSLTHSFVHTFVHSFVRLVVCSLVHFPGDDVNIAHAMLLLARSAEQVQDSPVHKRQGRIKRFHVTLSRNDRALLTHDDTKCTCGKANNNNRDWEKQRASDPLCHDHSSLLVDWMRMKS